MKYSAAQKVIDSYKGASYSLNGANCFSFTCDVLSAAHNLQILPPSATDWKDMLRQGRELGFRTYAEFLDYFFQEWGYVTVGNNSVPGAYCPVYMRIQSLNYKRTRNVLGVFVFSGVLLLGGEGTRVIQYDPKAVILQWQRRR